MELSKYLNQILTIEEFSRDIIFEKLSKKANIRFFQMTKEQLRKKLAYLESINDQLSTEVSYVDQLMRMVGFSGGLTTVKETAKEIIDKGLIESY